VPSSATFWTLMERWQVPDDQALELIAYEGKLPTTGKRPRFKLSITQAEIVSSLVEIDIALTAAGMDAEWLRKPMSDTDRAPLDLLRAGANGGGAGFAEEVNVRGVAASKTAVTRHFWRPKGRCQPLCFPRHAARFRLSPWPTN
jgi:hypothetical protein